MLPPWQAGRGRCGSGLRKTGGGLVQVSCRRGDHPRQLHARAVWPRVDLRPFWRAPHDRLKINRPANDLASPAKISAAITGNHGPKANLNLPKTTPFRSCCTVIWAACVATRACRGSLGNLEKVPTKRPVAPKNIVGKLGIGPVSQGPAAEPVGARNSTLQIPKPRCRFARKRVDATRRTLGQELHHRAPAVHSAAASA